MGQGRRVGRPQAPLPRAESLLTRRIRAVIQLSHRGNLAEASRASGIPYPTLRDLYVGRTANPGVQTVQAMADAYGLSLDWFRDAEEPDELPAWRAAEPVAWQVQVELWVEYLRWEYWRLLVVSFALRSTFGSNMYQQFWLLLRH